MPACRFWLFLVCFIFQANADHIDHDGNCPLLWALQVEHWEAAIVLLESGAMADVRNSKGHTALMRLCDSEAGPRLLQSETNRNLRIKTTNLLLRAQADPNSTNVYGFSALSYASKHGHYDVAACLLQSKVIVDLHVEAV